MRSAAYTILTSVLLLAPISAVPLMAIFGVPQFTPVVASPLDETDESDDDWDRPSRKPPRSKAAQKRVEAEDVDPFEESLDWDEPTKDRLKPIQMPRTRSRDTASAKEAATVPSQARNLTRDSKPSAAAPKPRRPLPPDEESETEVEFASSESNDDLPAAVESAAFEHDIEETPESAPATLRDSIPGYRRSRSGDESERANERTPSRFRRSTSSGDPLTWSKAVVRLNELGIRNFKLQPGVQPGEFTFTCSYTPTNSPHVTRRFEAEADDPLKAVSQVLSQVERWAQQREATMSKQKSDSLRDVE